MCTGRPQNYFSSSSKAWMDHVCYKGSENAGRKVAFPLTVCAVTKLTIFVYYWCKLHLLLFIKMVGSCKEILMEVLLFWCIFFTITAINFLKSDDYHLNFVKLNSVWLKYMHVFFLWAVYMYVLDMGMTAQVSMSVLYWLLGLWNFNYNYLSELWFCLLIRNMLFKNMNDPF